MGSKHFKPFNNVKIVLSSPAVQRRGGRIWLTGHHLRIYMNFLPIPENYQMPPHHLPMSMPFPTWQAPQFSTFPFVFSSSYQSTVFSAPRPSEPTLIAVKEVCMDPTPVLTSSLPVACCPRASHASPCKSYRNYNKLQK